MLVLSAAWAFYLYYPGLSGGFLFDDRHTLVDNPYVKPADLNLDSLDLAKDSFAGGGRQVSMLSFTFNHYLFGSSAFHLKLVNVLLHLTNGFLLWLLMFRLYLVVSTGVKDQNRRQAYCFALIVAGLWLTAPINLTSVLYISQRMNLLAVFFILLGLVVIVRRDVITHRLTTLVAFLFCIFLGFLSKENGILILPLALMLFLFQSRHASSERRRVLLLSVLWGGTALLITYIVYTNALGVMNGYEVRSFTLSERLLTQLRVLVFYMNQTFVPNNTMLGFWHDDFQVSISLFEPWDTWVAALALLALLSGAIGLSGAYPLLSIGLNWFLIAHLLESTVLPLEIVHEHRNYLASIGLFVVMAFCLLSLAKKSGWLSILLFILAFSFYSTTLYARAEIWSESIGHALTEYQHHPQSSRAALHAGSLLLSAYREGHLDSVEPARQLLLAAADLDRNSALPELSLLTFPVQQEDGLFVEQMVERIVFKFRQKSELESNIIGVQNLRRCVEERHCRIAVSSVLPMYEEIAKSTSYKMKLEAALFYTLAAGDQERATSLFQEVVEMAPHESANHLNLIKAYIESGDFDKAENQLAHLLSNEAGDKKYLAEEIEVIIRLLERNKERQVK